VLLHYWSFGWLYTIGVVYDDLGILILYTGEIPDEPSRVEGEDIVAICPTQNRPTEIGLWLTDPAANPSVSDAFAQFGYIYPDPHPFYRTTSLERARATSLEQATGMNLETFYNAYLNPDTPTCLEASGKLGDNVP